MLLTQLEMTSLYDSINFSTPFVRLHDVEAVGPNFTAASLTVEVFLCPLDGLTTAMPLGPNNYRANAGPCGYCDGPAVPLFPPGQTGEFTDNGTKAADFADGLSNTLAFSEKLVGGVSNYIPNRDLILVPNEFLPTRPPSSTEWLNVCWT